MKKTIKKRLAAALAANGLTKGSNGRLMPKDSCTVEQSILMVYRLYDSYPKR